MTQTHVSEHCMHGGNPDTHPSVCFWGLQWAGVTGWDPQSLTRSVESDREGGSHPVTDHGQKAIARFPKRETQLSLMTRTAMMMLMMLVVLCWDDAKSNGDTC